MHAITDSIFTAAGMRVGRVYVIAGQDGLALVDTSVVTDCAGTLEPQLKQHGFQLTDIRHILITHAHYDHVGGLAGFQKTLNARTYTHRREAPIVRGEQPPVYARMEDLRGVNRIIRRFMNATFTPARVDAELKEGDTLDMILPGLRVVETPGHSYGHISLYWPEKRLLFGGDVMMRLRWGLATPFAVATPDMAEAKRSIRKVADLGVDILCPGHGVPLVGSASPVIQMFAGKLGV